MNKIRVAIVGFGHVGECALQSIVDAPDMEAAGVVMRPASVHKLAHPGPLQPCLLETLPVVEIPEAPPEEPPPPAPAPQPRKKHGRPKHARPTAVKAPEPPPQQQPPPRVEKRIKNGRLLDPFGGDAP